MVASCGKSLLRDQYSLMISSSSPVNEAFIYSNQPVSPPIRGVDVENKESNMPVVLATGSAA